MAAEPTGYADPAYAASLLDTGTPRSLPRSRGSILVRPIGGGPDRDATGPYPLFSCRDWARLGDDVDELEGALVALVVVADPFGEWTKEQLERAFPDVCVPFKEHWVVDLSRPPLRSASRHHRRDAARALRRARVEPVARPQCFADEWGALYEQLVRRHEIDGAAAFSSESLARQLAVPGVRVFRADGDQGLLGAAVWFVDRGVAYYHLSATTDAGYAIGASYALVATALETLAAEGAAWAELGGAAGVTARAGDGLARFKAGWATATRSSYLCGRILDRARYERLAEGATGAFFPAYRSG